MDQSLALGRRFAFAKILLAILLKSIFSFSHPTARMAGIADLVLVVL
jgi:hypothetical protein